MIRKTIKYICDNLHNLKSYSFDNEVSIYNDPIYIQYEPLGNFSYKCKLITFRIDGHIYERIRYDAILQRPVSEIIGEYPTKLSYLELELVWDSVTNYAKAIYQKELIDDETLPKFVL